MNKMNVNPWGAAVIIVILMAAVSTSKPSFSWVKVLPVVTGLTAAYFILSGS